MKLVPDEMIIDHAISFFKQYNHLHLSKWFIYCKLPEIKLPRTYEITKYRFDSEHRYGFYKFFLRRCKENNIPVAFDQIAPKNIAKKILNKMAHVYHNHYDDTFPLENLPVIFKHGRKTREKMKNAIKMKNDIIHIENELIRHAIILVKETGDVSYGKWQKYRIEKNLRRSICASYFNGKGWDGFYEQFVIECAKQNIELDLGNIVNISRCASQKLEKYKAFYDTYQKVKKETYGI
jgi:hypothetical protein